jgi:UDP-2,3-diacylglucosamine hydrolase
MASPQGEALLSLIKIAQNEASTFVILGDLFDLWIGEAPALHDKFAPLISEFKKLKVKCRILYLEGNHDFHLKKFWEDELGFEVFTGPYSFEASGLQIRAEHGDQINPDDRGYLFLRWFLRTHPLKFLIANVPSRLVSMIGERASHTSRAYTTGLRNKVRVEKIISIGRDYAQKLRTKVKFDLLIMGHTHVADDFEFRLADGVYASGHDSARVINLGSWADSPHYLEINCDGKIIQQIIK